MICGSHLLSGAMSKCSVGNLVLYMRKRSLELSSYIDEIKRRKKERCFFFVFFAVIKSPDANQAVDQIIDFFHHQSCLSDATRLLEQSVQSLIYRSLNRAMFFYKSTISRCSEPK